MITEERGEEYWEDRLEKQKLKSQKVEIVGAHIAMLCAGIEVGHAMTDGHLGKSLLIGALFWICMAKIISLFRR